MELESLLTRQDIPKDVKKIIENSLAEFKRIESKYRSNEELLRTLLKISPNTSILLDKEGIILEINETAAKELGKKSDEIRGRCVFDFFPPDVASIGKKRFKEVISSKKAIQFENKRDGMIFEYIICPVINENNEVKRMTVFSSDITERKRAEHKEREDLKIYQRIIEQMEESVSIEDAEGIITFVNPRYLEISGFNENDVVGKHWSVTVPPEDLEQVKTESKKRPKGISSTYESITLTKSGSIIPIIVAANPIFSKTGDFEGVISVFTDVVERKKVEEELQESRELYQRLVEQMAEGVVVEDVKGIITFVNPKYLEITGFSEDELLGKHWSIMVPPEKLDEVRTETNKRWKGISSSYESSINTKRGSITPIHVTASPLFSKAGEFEGVLALISDITEKKEIERQLVESKGNYQMLVEKMEEGVILENEEGILSFMNQGSLEMHGYSEDEVLGKHWSILVAPEDQKNVQAETEKRPKGTVSHYESLGRKKDGSIFPVSVTATPIFSEKGEYKGVLSVVIDITERKQAEEALKESKDKYQMLVEKLDEGVILEDSEGFFTFVNPKITQLVGYTKEELIGKHWSEIIHENNIDQVQKEVENRTKGISNIYESCVQTKNGNPIPVIITATPIFSKTGEFDGVLGVFTDITKQKKVEKELRKSKEKYQMLVEKLEEALCVEDSKGIITFVNPKTVEILGYSEEEIIGKHWSNFVTDEYVDDGYKETVKRPKGISSTYESSLTSRDGTRIPMIITATPIFSSSGEYDGTIALATDITERKEVEQKLLQVKQEEERYHAMLSHFINNDMQKIINNLELVSLMYDSDIGLDQNTLDKAMTIASGSSKTIDAVTKIFGILQSTFIIPKKGSNLLYILNEVISELSKDPLLFNIHRKDFDVEIKVDSNFKDVLKGLLLFVFSSKDITPETRIDIQGSFLPTYYSILINDCWSEPLSNDIISKLSGNITDEWEVIGHNIDIALASVIMKHYGGSLIIQSLTPKGNEFQLLFPFDVIKPLDNIESG